MKKQTFYLIGMLVMAMAVGMIIYVNGIELGIRQERITEGGTK